MNPSSRSLAENVAAECASKSDEEAYQEALGVIDQAIVFGIHPSLDGINALMDAMGRPHEKYPCVQVAGTNGKTSTARMIAALLRAHGLKAGLYTSPHLVEYPERIEVEGSPISHGLFARAILLSKAAADTLGNMEITEFELETAAALWVFAESGVDVAVLECGMGGRWDATSVVCPKVAIVTGIGLDHIGILGSTVEEIAAEKAAIVKPGCETVLGPGTQSTLQVFAKRAAECGVEPWLVREELDAREMDSTRWCDGYLHIGDARMQGPVSYEAGYASDDEDAITVSVRTNRGFYPDIEMRAPLYQAQNISTALAAAELFYGQPLDPHKVREAIGGFSIPGRFETLSEQPLLIIDAAHNPQSAINLATAVAKEFPAGDFQLLLAVLADKDAHGIIEALCGLTPDIAVTQTHSPRALAATELCDMVREATGTEPETFESPELALDALLGRGVPVLATGSITLAGEVKGLWLSKYKPGRSLL